MKKFWKKKKDQKTFYIIGALVLVAVVAGAYVFSSGDLFKGALPRFTKTSPTLSTSPTYTSPTTVSGTTSTTITSSTTIPSSTNTASSDLTLNTSTTTVSGTTQQFAPPKLTSLTVDRQFYNPQTQTLKISYKLEGLTGATILYAVIFDNDGNFLYRRQFTPTEDPQYLSVGTHTLTWDGKDFYGKTVPPNGYYVKVHGRRDTDVIAEQRKTFTVLNNNLAYAGANTPVSFPRTSPSVENLVIKENTYVPSTGKYRVKVAFDLYASSGDNQLWLGFRDAKGVQYNDWTFKDLPNGKYELFWDGMRYTGEMINTWTQRDYILNTSGHDENVYKPDMAKELKMTLPVSY